MPDVPPPHQAYLLAAGASSPTVLVVLRPDGTARLPPLGEIQWPDEHPSIAAAVAGYLGRPHPVIRVLAVPATVEGTSATAFVVVEPVPVPHGQATPVPADDPRLASLGLEPAAAAVVGRWLDEVRGGAADPRRQRWELPGFQDRARRWMAETLAAAGTPVIGEPVLQSMWAISALLRADTTAGRTFLKCCARVFDAEPALTAALDQAVPGAVPAVVATDPGEGWLLMRDAGGEMVGDGSPESWAPGLAALAAIQRACGGTLDGVALEDRGPAALAAALPELADGPWVGSFPDDVRSRFRAAVPRLVDTCRRLADQAPGSTLVHGDIHPWNVLRDGDRDVVIDWSDSALGHPFTDLATYVVRAADPAVRRALLNAYLDEWAGIAPRAELEEAAMTALVVGALHQVESYRRIVESLEPGASWGLERAGASWARRSLAFLEHGLAAES